MDKMTDSELVAMHGIDAGLSKAFNNPNMSQGHRAVIRDLIMKMAEMDMTSCHAAMMSGYVGAPNSPALRQIQDAAKSGDMSVLDAKYQPAPAGPNDPKLNLHDDDRNALREHMNGQFSFGFGEHAQKMGLEVQELENNSKEFEAARNQGTPEGRDEALRLHLKFMLEVLGKSEFQQTAAEKLRDFLKHASPETKERMKGVTPDEFVAIMVAMSSSGPGEAGAGKTSKTDDLFRQWFSYHG
jgi:hypothetical protein